MWTIFQSLEYNDEQDQLRVSPEARYELFSKKIEESDTVCSGHLLDYTHIFVSLLQCIAYVRLVGRWLKVTIFILKR